MAAARAEAAAASNALKTVETGINYYAARKEYIKLKDIAEASDVAGKVCCCLRHLACQHSQAAHILQTQASGARL